MIFVGCWPFMEGFRFLIWMELRKLWWRRPTNQSSSSIHRQRRCTGTWYSIIDSLTWSRMCIGTSRGAFLVGRSRSNIIGITRRCIYWIFPCGNKKQITIDFITKLPRTTLGVDSIWVIVDQLTNSSHFIPTQESSFTEKFFDIYIIEVVARHGVSVYMVANWDIRFTYRFWKKFH